VKGKRTKTIAPRLASGEPRVPFAHGLPDGIKEGLRQIAEMEGESMAWVVEKVFYDYFHLKPPQFARKDVRVKPARRGMRLVRSKAS